MKLLPCGEHAVLVELPDAATRRALDEALCRTPVAGVRDHVPAATTVLLHLDSPGMRTEVCAAVRRLDLSDAPTVTSESQAIEIPVRYCGEDLDTVARLLGLSVPQVVARHTGQLWTVDFAGFMPGFGYLTGADGGLTVPRRATPRTRIPAGSVALAGDYTGLYPQASPGGWQLIGTTDVTLWDVASTPPALLAPGTRVRFVDATRSAA